MSILSTRSLTEKIAFVTGLIGVALGAVVWGFYHWGGNLLWGLIQIDADYKPNFSSSNFQFEMLKYYVLLFVPACLALTSILFNKKHYMYLAVFLHLPIGDFISGIPEGIGSFATIQIVWVLYVISAILMTIKIKALFKGKC